MLIKGEEEEAQEAWELTVLYVCVCSMCEAPRGRGEEEPPNKSLNKRSLSLSLRHANLLYYYAWLPS
jgi:hypothetical protein